MKSAEVSNGTGGQRHVRSAGRSSDEEGMKFSSFHYLPFLVAGALAAFVMVQEAMASPQETARFNDWTIYRHEDQSGRICFALSAPTSMQPDGPGRSGAYFYISAWPRQGVRAEPSLRSPKGYREDSTVTLSIDGSNFILLTDGFTAYIDDPTRELKLIDAMKKGSTMVVRGIMGNGIAFRDSYSLNGVTAALGAVTQNCS